MHQVQTFKLHYDTIHIQVVLHNYEIQALDIFLLFDTAFPLIARYISLLITELLHDTFLHHSVKINVLMKTCKPLNRLQTHKF